MRMLRRVHGTATYGWHVSRIVRRIMNILWTLIIGLVVGALAKLVMPGKDPGGVIVTIILGVAGAFVAHFVGETAGWYAPNEPAGFLSSIIGAVVLLAGYRMIVGRRV